MKFMTTPLLLATLALGACTTLSYDDPKKVETLTIDFGSTDLQELAGHMVQSLVNAQSLNYIQKPGDDKRIVLYVGAVNNRTSEHIDTGGITDSIKVPLLQSGKFRLATSQQGQDELAEQVRFQQGEGRVDPAQAKAFGRQVGADVILYGNLRSIEKSKSRNLEEAMVKKDDVWYQFTLEAVNIETGEVIWADQKELRKSKKTGLFGK